MKCPRCGADNAERAEWCYLCEYPFAGAGQPGETAAPGAPPGPDPGFPPPPPPGATAGLTPPGMEPGYQPPPPGADLGYQPPPPGAGPGYPPPGPGEYPPAYRPSPIPERPRNTKAIAIGVVGVILIVAAALLVYFFVFASNPKIVLDTPPGYTAADDKEMKQFKESMEASGEDVTLDYVFIDDTSTTVAIVVHQKFWLEETPPDDPEKAKEYYLENKDKFMEGFDVGIADIGGMTGDMGSYSVETMANGKAALRMDLSVTMYGTSMYVDFLFVAEDKTVFILLAQGIDSDKCAELVEFFKQNAKFE